MSYKPKYCCQCGEKIENVEQKFFASPRFCELCATDFGFYDLIQRIISGIGLILIVFLISNYFQKPEKSLNVASNQFKGDIQGVKTASNNRGEVLQVQNTNAVQIPARQLNDASPVNPAVTAKIADSNKQTSGKTPVEASETTYLCGAPTQKGVPCSRRVKGGGRCWQHEEQKASVSSDKRIVSR
jgi:hypothetical protein